MSANWGKNIELSIFGESHGEAIGIIIGNLPSGLKLDYEFINKEMKRRAPGQNQLSTARVEADGYDIVSGVLDGITTGAPLCAMIKNTSQHSKDYEELKTKMRPGHSDYPAFIKFKGYNDVRGGGMFSGRLTAPIVFAGAIAKQILKDKGIEVGAHILSIHNVFDDHFGIEPEFYALKDQLYPVINKSIFKDMEECIIDAKKNGDSVGGKIECAITGVPAGIGAPFFDSVESHLATLLWSIPAVKSVSFGDLDDITLLNGSQANDTYYYDQDTVKTKTNHNGGILGGISNGMPIVFTVGIKPTASISLPQDTVDVKNKTNTILKIGGRHDPCIVPRAVVVVEAMAALGILDMLK